MNETLNEVTEILLNECELSKWESRKKLQLSLEMLNGVYICIEDNTYKIMHDELFDFLAKLYGEMMIEIFICYADSELIRDRFFCENLYDVEVTADVCIKITNTNIDLFMERLVTDWSKGRVSDVFCNTNMKSVIFRKKSCLSGKTH